MPRRTSSTWSRSPCVLVCPANTLRHSAEHTTLQRAQQTVPFLPPGGILALGAGLRLLESRVRPRLKQLSHHAIEQLFEGNHGEHERQERERDRDGERHDLLPADRHEAHSAYHLVRIGEIGERLDIGSAYERL